MSGPLLVKLNFSVIDTSDVDDKGQAKEVVSFPLSWANQSWPQVTMIETAIIPVIVERMLLLGVLNAASKDPEFLAQYAQLKAALSANKPAA